ncbi:MAG: AraC family transcriptional regulator, partial [Aristaeellaceae bacterium]
RSFRPWTDGFTRGLYLAGVECAPDAQPPQGWVRWLVPGFEYLCAERESDATFAEMFDHMKRSSLSLAGAAQDFTCPATGKNYILFPIRRL